MRYVIYVWYKISSIERAVNDYLQISFNDVDDEMKPVR